MMNKLIEKLKNTDALIRPVTEETINQAEKALNISFSNEYKSYLSTCGVISLESAIGDGHFYLYNNHAKTILIWASPNGGIVKEIKSDLEEFLISLLFG